MTFNNDEKDDFKNCGICLIEFEENEDMTILECHKEKDRSTKIIIHIFHVDCIQKWFVKKLECPLCRTSFKAKFKKSIAEHPAANATELNLNITSGSGEERSEIHLDTQSLHSINLQNFSIED